MIWYYSGSCSQWINECKYIVNRVKGIKRLRKLVHLSKPVAKLLFNIIGLRVNRGSHKFDTKLKIIVVSHEVSRTGPHTGLEYCGTLKHEGKHNNYINERRELWASFIESSCAIEPRFNIVPIRALNNALKEICNDQYPECSIVNSVVSTRVKAVKKTRNSYDKPNTWIWCIYKTVRYSDWGRSMVRSNNILNRTYNEGYNSQMPRDKKRSDGNNATGCL